MWGTKQATLETPNPKPKPQTPNPNPKPKPQTPNPNSKPQTQTLNPNPKPKPQTQIRNPEREWPALNQGGAPKRLSPAKRSVCVCVLRSGVGSDSAASGCVCRPCDPRTKQNLKIGGGSAPLRGANLFLFNIINSRSHGLATRACSFVVAGLRPFQFR
jgi:hypothetical protein